MVHIIWTIWRRKRLGRLDIRLIYNDSHFGHINIFERAIRLFFDLLHGVKRMYVPLVTGLEFLIFLGFDGKLEMNSELEKDLFLSAVDQLKERFNSLAFILCKNFVLPTIW